MASGRFMEEMMREHEQSLLEATCGGLFDHIDDLLDFPKEDSAADVLLLDAPAPGSPLAARVLDVGAGAETMALPAKEQQPEFLALPPPLPARDDPAFMAALGDAHIGSCDELDMDMAQLEWLSGLFDDTSIPHEPAFAASAACAQPIIRASALGANAGVVLPDAMEDALFRSSSPTSVLEDSGFNGAAAGANNKNGSNGGSSASSSSSSASSSSESFSGSARPWSVPVSPRPEPPVLTFTARARSKRSRASAFPTAIRAAAPAPEATILVPTPMYTSSHSEPECIAESNDSELPVIINKKKKKAKKPAPPVTSDAEGDADYEEGSGGAALPPGAVRRCTHCQIEKTPQWRAGPLGPKTLCNACGVRYKSGRLFPEYRPAASPTFVPAIHSNSHKKVVEMRQKVEPKGDDLLQFIRVRRD